MLDKIKKFILDLLNAIKKNLIKNPSAVADINNQKYSTNVEAAINVFRKRNALFQYNHNEILKNIAKAHSENMSKENRLLYDYKGFTLRFELNKYGLNSKYAIMMISFADGDNIEEKLVRNIISNIVYRNSMLSSKFDLIGVYVYNGYCTSILASGS